MDVGTEGEVISHFIVFVFFNIDQLYQVLLKSFKTHWKKLNQNLDRKREKWETDKMCHVSALPLTAGLLSVSGTILEGQD